MITVSPVTDQLSSDPAAQRSIALSSSSSPPPGWSLASPSSSLRLVPSGDRAATTRSSTPVSPAGSLASVASIDSSNAAAAGRG